MKRRRESDPAVPQWGQATDGRREDIGGTSVDNSHVADVDMFETSSVMSIPSDADQDSDCAVSVSTISADDDDHLEHAHTTLDSRDISMLSTSVASMSLSEQVETNADHNEVSMNAYGGEYYGTTTSDAETDEIVELDLTGGTACKQEMIKTDRHFPHLTDLLNQESYHEPVDEEFIATRAEMLLAIVKFGIVPSLGVQGMSELFQMHNSYFRNKVLPDSVYYMNKLFTSDTDKEYHAVCPTCKTYAGQFFQGQRTIRCDVCEVDIKITDPSFTNFFVTNDIESELKAAVEQNIDHYLSEMNKPEKRTVGDVIKDITDGQRYVDFVNSLPPETRKAFLTAIFNTDGAPTHESSKGSVWLIQIVLNEMPYTYRASSPIVCAAWFGREKPDMDIFLATYVNHMNKLSTQGFKCTVNDQVMTIKLFCLCGCVDSGARAPVQGFVQYNGMYGCCWCLNPGKWVPSLLSKSKKPGGCYKFSMEKEPAELRNKKDTVDTMVEMEELQEESAKVHGKSPPAKKGIKKLSALIGLLNFHIIFGLCPDYMHAICLGIAPQFVNYWLKSTKKAFSLPSKAEEMIDEKMKSIKVPHQLCRLSRKFKDRCFWTAREWENWVLYYSVPVLSSFYGFEKYVDHWSLLVEALHILLGDQIKRSSIDYADGLLRKYLSMLKCEVILKKCVFQRPVVKIADFLDNLGNRYAKSTLKISEVRYVGRSQLASKNLIQRFDISERSRIYSKMIKDRCIFNSQTDRCTRSDDSFAQTIDGQFVRIRNFIVDELNGKEFVVCNVVQTRNRKSPRQMKEIANIENKESIIRTNRIDRICVCVALNDGSFISPVPNLYFY
ncbi:hypothetical protein QAD02_013627 [Eretmocerus hayati]|uniref:Uncharacterized protein n=1 Tax=Eretmocerus hayati TaxID=131215 RepID=A0ACC2P368_9HYME|nr:hypothetical protein QAD02_013627 [Eretmocerus hayati]